MHETNLSRPVHFSLAADSVKGARSGAQRTLDGHEQNTLRHAVQGGCIPCTAWRHALASKEQTQALVRSLAAFLSVKRASV